MDKESDGGEAHHDFGKMVEFSDFGKEEDKASAKLGIFPPHQNSQKVF